MTKSFEKKVFKWQRNIYIVTQNLIFFHFWVYFANLHSEVGKLPFLGVIFRIYKYFFFKWSGLVSLELNLMNDNFEHKCPGNVVRFLQYIKYLELIKISFVYVWTLINVSLNTFLPCRTLIKPLFNFSPVKYSPPLIWCIKVTT